jgi:hypothetical protein
MVTGHFAAGFALKAYDKTLSLWFLFLATQLVDIAFMVFLLTDVEHLRIVPGFTEFNDLDLYHYPFTHGLMLTPLWVVALIGCYALWKVMDRRVALVIALAVSSHWLFDFLVHAPDLPLLGDSHKVGLGLWNYPGYAIALEAFVITLSIVVYCRFMETTSSLHKYLAIALGVMLVAAVWAASIAPTPHSVQEIAIGCLIIYALFIGAAYGLERGLKRSSVVSRSACMPERHRHYSEVP